MHLSDADAVCRIIGGRACHPYLDGAYARRYSCISFRRQYCRLLAVPFALLMLAIPIPQIIFNKISFPLQIWASKTAVWGIRLFEVPTVRKGNVFDILPAGSTQIISLEVVGACSGIRSLMTLVTLALVLGYFTSNSKGSGFANFRSPDLWRTICLMFLAVPIAVLTNAARVTGTGVLTYHFGKQATDGIWHELSGWLVYLVSLAMLFGLNHLLRHFCQTGADRRRTARYSRTGPYPNPVPSYYRVHDDRRHRSHMDRQSR